MKGTTYNFIRELVPYILIILSLFISFVVACYTPIFFARLIVFIVAFIVSLIISALIYAAINLKY